MPRKYVEGKVVTRDGRSVRIICFDAKQDDSIVALISYDNTERVKSYEKDGIVVKEETSPIDLMLEVPEYMTFKDGDILSNYMGDFTFMLNGNGKYKTSMHVYIGSRGLFFGGAANGNSIDYYRTATKEEKMRLIDALKASKDLRAKACLKKLGIESKPKCEFKPKDWVLTREDFEDKWALNIFSHAVWDEEEQCYHYYCVGGWNYECIPYEGNEHLLGTTENYK